MLDPELELYHPAFMILRPPLVVLVSGGHNL